MDGVFRHHAETFSEGDGGGYAAGHGMYCVGDTRQTTLLKIGDDKKYLRRVRKKTRHQLHPYA